MVDGLPSLCVKADGDLQTPNPTLGQDVLTPWRSHSRDPPPHLVVIDLGAGPAHAEPQHRPLVQWPPCAGTGHGLGLSVATEQHVHADPLRVLHAKGHGPSRSRPARNTWNFQGFAGPARRSHQDSFHCPERGQDQARRRLHAHHRHLPALLLPGNWNYPGFRAGLPCECLHPWLWVRICNNPNLPGLHLHGEIPVYFPARCLTTPLKHPDHPSERLFHGKPSFLGDFIQPQSCQCCPAPSPM